MAGLLWDLRINDLLSSEYRAFALSALMSIQLLTSESCRGCPPPFTQPPGQAIISTKSNFSPALIASISFLALPRPCATAALSSKLPAFTLAILIPSRPLTVEYSKLSVDVPFKISTTVLSAASITPPVTPKMCPAPVASPNGLSNSLS